MSVAAQMKNYDFKISVKSNMIFSNSPNHSMEVTRQMSNEYCELCLFFFLDFSCFNNDQSTCREQCQLSRKDRLENSRCSFVCSFTNILNLLSLYLPLPTLCPLNLIIRTTYSENKLSICSHLFLLEHVPGHQHRPFLSCSITQNSS